MAPGAAESCETMMRILSMPPALEALYQAAVRSRRSSEPNSRIVSWAPCRGTSLPSCTRPGVPNLSGGRRKWIPRKSSRSRGTRCGAWDGKRLPRTGPRHMANYVSPGRPPSTERHWSGTDGRSRSAAQALERAVDRVLSKAASSPEFYRHTTMSTGKPSWRYPTACSSPPGERDVLVVAVAHASREPGYWQSR